MLIYRHFQSNSHFTGDDIGRTKKLNGNDVVIYPDSDYGICLCSYHQ